MIWRPLRSLTVLFAVSALLLGACGDDDATDTDTPATDQTDDAGSADDPVDEAPEEPAEDDMDDDTGDDAEDAAPPAEDSGTVTIDGATTELAAADFLICETVNPAFDENINIVVALDGEPSQLRIAGDLPDEVNAQVGELPDEITVEGIDVTRDGRTVSGSADADGTMIEFSFTC